MIRLIFESQDTAQVQEIKEHLAMYLEQWHDIRLVAVEVIPPKQEDFLTERKRYDNR